jgi:Undecaprenyl-phosphate glucose phosphotransferase
MADLSAFNVDPLASVGRRSRTLQSVRIRRLDSLLVRIIAIEFLTVAGTSFLASWIYFKAVLTASPPSEQYIAAAFIIGILVLLVALCLKQHVAIQSQSWDRYLWSALGAVTLAFSLFLSLLYLSKIGEWYSRGTFLLQFVSVGMVILVGRGAIHSYVRRGIRSGVVEARRAVVVGDIKAHAYFLQKFREFGVHSAAALSFPPASGKSGLLEGDAFASEIESFVEQCRIAKSDDVIFLADPDDMLRVIPLVDALAELPVAVHVLPTGVNDLWAAARISSLGGAITIQVSRPLLSEFDRAVKRGFDVCVAGLCLIVLWPLLLMVALAIKLDSPGPVFFRQNRHGYNDEIIPVLKFRTMHIVEDGETATTFTQARANDSRLTRLGRILRRTNVDELMQLFNVLMGQMSIVGPRPHPIALNAMFRHRISLFSRRHHVKPGLTGWAQVHGLRGETDTIEKMRLRIEHDLHYIEHWSFLTDLKIILMTPFSRSAYRNAA